MNPNERAGPARRRTSPRFEQRGKGFSIWKITAEAGDTQAARREALRSAIVADEIKRLVDRAGGRS